MNPISTLEGWARSAWGAITGAPSTIVNGLSSLWRYITSLHTTLSWLFANPVLQWANRMIGTDSLFDRSLVEVFNAIARIDLWIWNNLVRPVRDMLNRRIDALKAWTALQLALLRDLVILLYLKSLTFTRQQIAIERAARIKADMAEHAAMLKAVKACLATVQKQASTGYATGLHDRLSVVGDLLNAIGTHNPEVKTLVATAVKAVIDLEEIDNPIARIVAGRLITEVIDKAGIDRLIGDLAGQLLGPLEGGARPADLYHVEADVSARLNNLEAAWAGFMASGGPEVEQAGREWRDITGLAADAAILGFVALAVADPQAWAAGISDAAGVPANDAMTAIAALVGRV